ncbi:UDP-glucose 4-epimerase GalE [Oricola cellulosilytica]|uniref:UDP-glucose 4-epimerase n=1 Tax=Oricola cellulosilytica TaxID=1429082 RepID=A0A4R0PAV5_9HYPH|nr:UDP-glucose 4-epimerase GalE [Oricola cellulosilytica]TCD14370.1 UDP-glucose 4-epimerase GalE [Oricola cellulosilytica]
MAVLVTGGAGYIGSHMVWALLEAGEEVVVLDRLSTGFEWAVAPEARLFVGDVGDTGLVSSLIANHAVDAIVHFAGSVVVPESIADPLLYYDNNTARSRTLIETAVRNGVRNFVFSSSAAVYGSVGAEPVQESHPCNPDSPYGMSKLMTETILQDAALAHDFRYAALRYFNVAGADPEGRTGQSTKGATHLIKVACEAALGKRGHIEVFGTDYDTPDGTCIRDYIHVTDLVKAHLHALESLRRTGESLVANCGYGRGYSVLEVLDCVKRVTGRTLDVRYAARREGDAEAVVANSDRARGILGWRPEHANLDRIVASAFSWEEDLLRRNSPKASA